MIEYSEIREIKKIIERLRKRRSENLRLLDEAVDGHLRMEKSNGAMRYYQVVNRGGKRVRKGITKDKDAIRRLTQKEYIEIETARIEKNINILEETVKRLEDTTFAGIVTSMPRHFDGFPISTFINRK